MNTSRPLAAAIAACLALLSGPAAGCGGDDGSGGRARDAVKVDVASFKFAPDAIKVNAGGTVTWINHDKAPHTAEAEETAPTTFDTGRLDTGDSKTIRVDRPGKYRYFCRFHRFMTGTVEVVK